MPQVRTFTLLVLCLVLAGSAFAAPVNQAYQDDATYYKQVIIPAKLAGNLTPAQSQWLDDYIARFRASGPARDLDGGPDHFGYTWRDDAEPLVSYEWYDITGVGDQLEGVGDDWNSGALDLGWAFNFYGTDFDQIHICSNGYVSFTSDVAIYASQYALPSVNVPENLLAVQWTDLDPTAGGAIWFYTNADEQYAVVSWIDIPPWNNGGEDPQTFQLAFNSDGQILYQYQDGNPSMPDVPVLVGIQNATQDDGLTVFYDYDDAAYLAAERAIGFAVQWIDPDHAVIEADPTAVDFGDVYAGDSPSVDVTVINVGAPDLTIDQVSTDNDVFVAPRMNENIVLASEESHVFAVQFAPQAQEAYNGNFIIHSDAFNGDGDGNFMVPLTGNGLVGAPEIGLVTDPDPMDFELNTGGTDEGLITVGNSGDHPLIWETEIEELEGRDAGSRALRRVDGAASPRRDEPGETLFDIELNRIGSMGFAWDAENEIMYVCQNDNAGGAPRITGYAWDGDEITGVPVDFVLANIPANSNVGLGYFNGVCYTFYWGQSVIYRYDTDGNALQTIATQWADATTFGLGLAVDPETAYLYMSAYHGGGLHSDVKVYDINNDYAQVGYMDGFENMGEQMDADVRNRICWVPEHEDGHLWFFERNYADNPGAAGPNAPPYHAWQVNVIPAGADEEWDWELVTHFEVEADAWSNGIGHDGKNLWIGDRYDAIVHIVDDGISEVGWVSLAPEEGIVDAGDGQDVAVLINSFGLVGAEYNANVHFLSNDPTTPDAVVAVSLLVHDAPDITVTWPRNLGCPQVVDWNLAYPDLFNTHPYPIVVKVKNVGSIDLNIQSLAFDDPDGVFSADPAENFPAIAAGASMNLTLTLNSAASGLHQATATLTSDDPYNGEYSIQLSGETAAPPLIDVAPQEIADSLYTGGYAEHTLELTNIGEALLRWNADIELIENERDAGGRELRRVDGAVGPKRDDAGDLLGEFNGINQANVYCSPAGWDEDNNWMWVTQYNNSIEVAYSFDAHYQDFVEEVRVNQANAMCGTWANGTVYLPTNGSTQANRYDAAGQNVGSIQLPFGIFGLAADNEEGWLFAEESSNNYAIHVYQFADDGGVGDEIGVIGDHLAFHNNTYNLGIEWAPGDKDGKLWIATYNDGNAWEIAVDEEEWTCTETIQHFDVGAVGQPYVSLGHDAHNIWAAGYNAATIRIYDDGISEYSWIGIISPEEGEGALEAGESQDVVIYLNAFRLAEDVYEANIHFLSNDPNTPDFAVPVSLDVTGAADIDATWDEDYGYPDVLDWNLFYPDLYTGAPYTMVVQVANEGTVALTVDDVFCENPVFIANPNQFELAAEETRDVTITFEADIDAPDDYTGDMVFATNDPDEEQYIVNMHAHAYLPPIGSVSPDRVGDELYTGEKSDHALTVFNEGDAPLRFTVELVFPEERDASGRELRRVDGAVGPKRDDPGDLLGEFDKPAEFQGMYSSVIGWDWDNERMGVAGYYDSNIHWFTHDANYENFEDVATTNVGQYTCMDGTWLNGLTYAGNWFNGLRRYDADGNNIDNLNLNFYTYGGSAADVKNNRLFVSDQNQNNNIHVFQMDDDNNIVEELGVINNFTQFMNGGYSYGLEWVPKHPDGQLWMSYYNDQNAYEILVDEDNWQATAAVQNFNVGSCQPYDGMGHDGHNLWASGYGNGTIRVYDDGITELSWLVVTPEEGQVEGGNQTDVNARLDAEGLEAGVFEGTIVFHTNDPSNAAINIPVSLTVNAAADIEVTWQGVWGEELIDWNAFYGDQIFHSGPYTATVKIKNSGVQNLEITDFICDAPEFTASQTEFVLEPDVSTDITLTFLAEQAGDYAGTFTVENNSVVAPEYQFNVHAYAVNPPLISVEPDVINDSLYVGETSQHAMTVYNNGDVDLFWDLGIEMIQVPGGPGRDASGRELRRVDGAVGPKRDDPGDLLGEFNGINQANQYCSAAGWDQDNNWMWMVNYSPGVAAAYSFDANYQDFVEEVRINPGNVMDGCWANGTVYMANLGNNVANRYDAAGQNVGSIQLPIGIYGLAADTKEGWLFAMESGNNYAIHVYEFTEDGGLGDQIGVISNHLQFHNNQYTYGIEWCPKDEDGKLWMATYNDGNAWEIAVDEDDWTCTETIQHFNVGNLGQPYIGLGHDAHNIWAGGYNASTIRIYDDGIVEAYWVIVEPSSGTVARNESQDLVLTFDAAHLWGGDYIADLQFFSNDPMHPAEEPDVVVRATLSVTAVPDIIVEAPLDDEEPIVVDFNDYFTDLFNLGTYKIPVTIINDGTADLNISAIESNEAENPVFGCEPAADIVVAGLSESIVYFTFHTDVAGEFHRAMTIFSDDRDEGEYAIDVDAVATEAPEMIVDPEGGTADDPGIAEDLVEGDLYETSFNIANAADRGAGDLDYVIEPEIIREPGDRDAGGRELRRVDGAVGPQRDDPGDLLGQFNKPAEFQGMYSSVIGWDWDNERMGVSGYYGTHIFWYTHDNNYENFEEVATFAVPQYSTMDGAWLNGITYLSNLQVGNALRRLDADGNDFGNLQFNFSAYGVAADVENNWLLVMETGNNYAIHVYQMDNDNAVVEQLGVISNHMQFHNQYSYGIEWVPKHPDGQLWINSYADQNVYEIAVDEDNWQATAAVQHFNAGSCQPYDGVGHDGHNLWASGYGNGTIRVYDDGVTEMYWLMVTPLEGMIPPGGDDDIIVTINSAKLIGGDYLAVLHIHNNDPRLAAQDVVWPAQIIDEGGANYDYFIGLTVTGAPHIEVTPGGPEDVKEPFGVPDKPPVDFGVGYFGWDPDDNIILYPDTAWVEIENVGTDDLEIDDIYSDDQDHFYANVDDLPLILSVGEVIIFPLMYTPDMVENNESIFHFITNDGHWPEEGVDVGYPVRVMGTGMGAPIIFVDPDVFDDLELGPGEIHDEEISVTNEGESMLDFEIEIQTDFGERDQAGRELRRVDGAVGPKRDDAGDLLGEFNGINQANQYCSAAGWDEDNDWMWMVNYSPGVAAAYSFDAHYQDFVEEVRINPGNVMDGCWAYGTVYMANLGNTTANRYDAAGQNVGSIQLPFGIYGLAADTKEGWLFVMESGNNYAIHVYQFTDDGGVGEQLGIIANHLQFHNNTYTYGIEWAPRDKDGKLWMATYNDGNAYEIAVDEDEWTCTETLQHFSVGNLGQPYAALGHDAHNIWAGGYSASTIRIYDDGVSEIDWIAVDPMEGHMEPGADMILILTLNATGLLAGEYYAELHFFSNDPANPVLTVPVTLTVRESPMVGTEPIFQPLANAIDEIPFPDTYVDGESRVGVTLINTGNAPLEITELEGSDEFWFDVNVGMTIAGFEEAAVNIVFSPDGIGQRDGVVGLYTNGQNVDEGHVWVNVRGLGEIAPEILTDPGDGGWIREQNRLDAEPWTREFTIGNAAGNGRRALAWEISFEDVELGGRDAAGRELRRVNGAAGPKRDDAGDVLDEYEIPYPSTTGLAWDPENELIWGYENNTRNQDGATIFAFSPDQGEVVAEFRIRDAKHNNLIYWEGLLYVQGNNQANATLFVYDLEGNGVDRINTPFSTQFRNSTIGEWNNQAYFFIRGTDNPDNGSVGEGSDAVYVYTWPDLEEVARIADAAETRDRSTAGVMWVPKDGAGQLWVDGRDRLYELNVDADWNCELVQNFRVAATVERAGMTHDKFDIWRAVRNWRWGGPQDDHTMLQRIDDGVAEQYWVLAEPDAGTTPAGESSVVNLNYTVANLLPDTTYLVEMLIESNDPVTPIVTIHMSLLTGVPPLRHFTGFTPTNLMHTVHVTEATFLNQPIPTGWEIGAFTPGGVLAGGAVWSATAADWMFTTYGDDPNTGGVEGFADGEVFTFMMWDEDADAEFGTEITFVNGDQRWVSDGESWLSLNGNNVREQVIDLASGWNLISLNIRPGEEYWNHDGVPGMREMIAQFRTDPGDDHTNRVFLLKDEEGRFVLPERDYYGITVWDVSQGYYVNVNEDVVGSWSGDAIPATEAIPVDAGWNMIPYYPDYDVTCRGPDFQAISSIVDNVLIAKNGWGEFAVPSLPFSNMRAWAPGMGFQIKVNADVSLVYPEEGGLNAVLADNRPDASSRHWAAPLFTGNNMSVLVTSVSGMMVSEGDEVAAFSSSGRIAGVGTFNADGQAGLGVWGDETITEEVVEGLIKGETFTLKIWDADRGEERRVAVNQGNALTYETNGLAVIDVAASAIVPDVYYLAQNFPNPFNAVTKVGYGLPEASYVTVRVFDVTGRVVATLVDGRQEAGRYVATWKADAAPAGVYFIKMESANFKQSVKTILMK